MAIDTGAQDQFMAKMRRDGEYPAPKPVEKTRLDEEAPQHKSTSPAEQLGLFGAGS